jgi:hypothetical protein
MSAPFAGANSLKLSVEFPDGKYDVQVVKNVILAVAPGARVIQLTPAEAILSEIKPLSREELELRQRAGQIAEAIINAPKSASWKGPYLSYLLHGGDTWEMSGGDSMASPRPEAIAFSRYLKKALPDLFPSDCKPPEDLAEHARVYFKEGGYKGIEYRPTKLGRAVAEILREKGFFKL